jgi:dihydroxyacetone kinase
LSAVTKAANQVIAGVISIGMSLDTCTVPGSPKEDRIPDGMAELGLGIHGEAGVEQVQFKSARQAIEMMVDRLFPSIKPGPHVALLNNLGSATALEMSVLTKELANSRIGSFISHIVGPASMMTSLDMHGFSISLLALDGHVLAGLQAAAAPLAWPGCYALSDLTVLPLPDGLTPIQPMPSQNKKAETLIRRCCEILIAAEGDLNALDAKSGDGDTGSTLTTASRALIKALSRLPLADWTQLYRAIGLELSQTMGGSSGVLLAIFFTAAGDASANGQDAVSALKAGLMRIQQVGGAGLGDRTMIDALSPALDALPNGLEAAATAARAGANRTGAMRSAKAGRASYVSETHLAGHNDPGAEAVAVLFEELFQTIDTWH